MRKDKRYAAFLSFADPDRELVHALSTLFHEVQQQVYFAPEALPKAGTPDWRKEIQRGVRDSRCFVPIYTRHSMNRPWVLYETGLADACGLDRFPARVSSVLPFEIEYLPGPGAYAFEIFNTKGLVDLIATVCSHGNRDRGEIEAKVETLVCHSPVALKVIALANTRWAFVAGNCPTSARLGSKGNRGGSRKTYLTKLAEFTQEFTEGLLDSGFSVMACPQVSAVGEHVIRTCVRLVDSKHTTGLVDFAIGGIHPIDRDARQTTLSETARKKWMDHIMLFRKSYLIDKEWIVVIGGNEGSREEYLAAKDLKVKVLAIPCFGGTAAAILREQKVREADSPCRRCTKTNGTCGRDGIGVLVRWMKDRRLRS